MKSYKFFHIRFIVLALMVLPLSIGVPCEHTYAATKTKTKTTGKTSSKKTNKTASSVAKSPKTSAEARRIQEATQKEIQQTKEKIRLNDQEIKENLADLNLLSSEIKAGRVQVANLQRQVKNLENEITTLNGNIDKNEAELQRMRDEYLKAVKKMRLNRKNQSMLAFIFSSQDFNQAMRRWRYIKQFAKWKQRKSDEINSKIAQLDSEKQLLAQAKEKHAGSLNQLSASQSQLEAKHRQQQRIVEGLRQNGAALQSHLSQKQKEANQLKSAIASLIAREQAKAEAERKAREQAEREKAAREKAARERAEAERIAREKAEAERLAKEKAAAERKEKDSKKSDKKKNKKKKEAGKDSKPRKRSGRKSDSPKPSENVAVKETVKTQVPTPGNASAFVAMQGKLPRPVEGSWRVTNPFGRHSMPDLPEVVYDNPGIDVEVTKGASVKAVYGGRVSGVYKLPGYGTVVIVNHGDYYTVYGNLSSVSVSVGNQLSVGQPVGSAAADPDDARRGSLHFELWHGREKQNPEAWLR